MEPESTEALGEARAPELSNQLTGGFWGLVTNFHNRTVLARVGNWVLATYGILLGLSFGLGFAVAAWFDGMIGEDPVAKLQFYLFFLVPSILMGARAASVLLDWRELFRRPMQTLVKPGYMLHGGLFGAMATLLIYSQLAGRPALAVMDAGAFAMPLGEAIARLGCYVYGCCWGRPTTSMFGVRYTSHEAKVIRCMPHLHGVKIHPTQLYGFATYLSMFALFYALLPYKQFDGMFTGLYLILHPITRMVMEYFREDDRGKLLGGLTHTHFYSLLMLIAGAIALAWGSARAGNTPADPGYRLLHVLSDPALLLWIVPIGIAAFLAFGVHYKKVGNWLGSHDAGKPTPQPGPR
jgi:phosphatidylglycerol:prolipoprotein diacylglycerol transferase